MLAQPRRLLIINDDRERTMALANLLLVAGYEVETAFDGPSAIESAEAFGPAICLIDVNVPRLNVYDLVRSFCQRLDQLPVLGNITPFSERDEWDADAEFDFDFSNPSDPYHVVEQLSNFLLTDSSRLNRKTPKIVGIRKPTRQR